MLAPEAVAPLAAVFCAMALTGNAKSQINERARRPLGPLNKSGYRDKVLT
jgi:hypothetical protein